MTTYCWAVGSHLKADAQGVGEHLDLLQREHGARLTPRVVLAAARPDDSPLHPCFEWDDLRAAELYREDQARYVIRSVRIVKQDGDRQVVTRAFVNVIETVDDDERRGYVEVDRAMTDETLRPQVLEQALKELRSFESRYQEFAELAAIVRTAREHVEQLSLLKPVTGGVR